MKQKWILAYMDVAERFAELSSATRLRVGAVIVKDNRIISIGYNGMPPGWDNVCEYKDWMPNDINLAKEDQEAGWPYVEYSDYDNGKEKVIIGRYRLKTKPEVIHAERNAIDKLAKYSGDGQDATLFVTHAPCIECAKSILTAGINTVYYRYLYRNEQGIDFLKQAKIPVIRVEKIK